LSDYYRNQQGTRRPSGEENQSWQQDASFLTDAPAQLGEQMQQGGVPLFGGMDFMAQGDDAPTRIGRPVNQQMVQKRTTVQSGAAFQRPESAAAPQAEPAAEEQPVRRRRSRVAERAAAEEAQNAAVVAEDPFRAGDSEEGKRRRILLKVLFPNRICYFLSSCLYVIPALFPEYFSAVCGRFLQITGGRAALFVEYNVLLIVLIVLLVATLVLSVFIRRHEDRLSMNAFL